MGKKGTKNGTCQIACLNFVKGSLKLGTQILYVKICIQICFLLFRLNLIFDDFFFPETEWEGISFSWLFQCVATYVRSRAVKFKVHIF